MVLIWADYRVFNYLQRIYHGVWGSSIASYYIVHLAQNSLVSTMLMFITSLDTKIK